MNKSQFGILLFLSGFISGVMLLIMLVANHLALFDNLNDQPSPAYYTVFLFVFFLMALVGLGICVYETYLKKLK